MINVGGAGCVSLPSVDKELELLKFDGVDDIIGSDIEYAIKRSSSVGYIFDLPKVVPDIALNW